MTTGGAKAVRRRRIFARDGHRCVYCGRALPEEQLSVDHVEPRRKGGDHSDGNLVTACLPCNRLKGGRPAWAFLAAEPEARAHFLRHARWVWPRHRRAVLEAAGGSADGPSPNGEDAGRAGPRDSERGAAARRRDP